MNLGFIGTGTIAKAMIEGTLQVSAEEKKIFVSPRNAQIANSLAEQFPQVKIAKDNQEIVEKSDVVFLCLRAQIAQEILSGLKFRPEQSLVSVVPTTTIKELKLWANGTADIYRAVPLPFVAKPSGMATPFYPANDFLNGFFQELGGAIVLTQEKELALFMVAGSMMGVYFHFLEGCRNWLETQGIAPEQARAYLSGLFYNLSCELAKSKDTNFCALEREFSTRGGTNEFLSKKFVEEGGIESLKKAIEETYRCIYKNS